MSNILMHGFDAEVGSLCSARGVTYTRYADDLAFSTDAPDVLGEVHRRVEEICHRAQSPRLSLNGEKTVHASRKNRRHVTGLILANDGSVSLGRERKKILRSAVHHFALGGLGVDETNRLIGHLAFARSVDPAFVASLKEKYGDATLAALRVRS